MLKEQIVNTATEQMSLTFEERNTHLGIEHGRLVSDFVKRGVLHGSFAIQLTAELYANEIKIRGELALGILLRAIRAYGVDSLESLGDHMKALLRQVIEREAETLTQQMHDRAPTKNAGEYGALSIDIDTQFATGVDHAMRKIATEVDLFAAHVSQSQTVNGDVTSPAIHVTGPVGAILTGDYASASVIQNLDSGAKAEIQRALNVIEAELSKIQPAQDLNKEEVLEMVQDSKIEITKDKPNISKLKATLVGIATSIQTTAALRPAYDGLKGALGLIGISLP